MDELQNHYTRWREAITKDYLLFESLYMTYVGRGKSIETGNRLLVAQSWGWEWRVIVKDREVLDWWKCSKIALQIHETPLVCTIQMGYKLHVSKAVHEKRDPRKAGGKWAHMQLFRRLAYEFLFLKTPEGSCTGSLFLSRGGSELGE